MTDTTNVLKIERLQDGGFVISDTVPFGCGENALWRGPRFAATNIGDALDYIRRALVPQFVVAATEELPKAGPGGVIRVKSP